MASEWFESAGRGAFKQLESYLRWDRQITMLNSYYGPRGATGID